MNNKEKRAKFRELAKHDRIRTATQLDEELAAPFLPFNEFKARVSQENRADAFRRTRRALEVGEAMIKLPQIEEFIRTWPFRRFYLETAGGNYVEVESERHIMLPPPNQDLILIYGTDGIVHHIDKNEILNAAVYGPVPHPTTNET